MWRFLKKYVEYLFRIDTENIAEKLLVKKSWNSFKVILRNLKKENFRRFYFGKFYLENSPNFNNDFPDVFQIFKWNFVKT